MNLIEISEKFPDELTSVKHFEKVRWGKIVKCAYCNSHKVSDHDKEYRHKCYGCNKTFFVTVNTQLHRTRIPLKTWLYAFSVVTDAKKGMSALQLERNLDVSYPTAFKMSQKIRTLMAFETNQPQELEGIVEMDEAYIGGKPRKGNSKWGSHPVLGKKNPKLDERIKELKKEGITFSRGKGNPAKIHFNSPKGRGTKNIPVVGIVERGGDVVAEVMKHTTYPHLKAMVEKYVKTDNSVLLTDEYTGYNQMETIIEHVKIDHSRYYSYKGINTNSIESFWAIVKRGITGQYHHITAKYLPQYIAEFVFKYNNRKVDDMFESLVKYAITA